MFTPGSFSTALSALVPAVRSCRSTLPMAFAPRVSPRPEGVAPMVTAASFLALSFCTPGCWGSCATTEPAARTGTNHDVKATRQRMTFHLSLMCEWAEERPPANRGEGGHALSRLRHRALRAL